MGIVAVLGGPTASGKTALALRWARARGLEILSADARQLYRGFSIGTGAPAPGELRAVPHHFIGCADPREAYSPRRFRAEAEALVRERPRTGFLVAGGTGLYLKEWMHPAEGDRGETPPEIRAAAAAEIAQRGLQAVHALLSDLDPEGMRGVAAQDAYRIRKRLENWRLTGSSYAAFRAQAAPNPLFANVPLLWLNPERAELHRRIGERVRDMLERGWAEEVRGLLREFDPDTTPAFNALGYRELAAAPGGPASEATAEKIAALTRRYAKKQITFFRHQFPGAREWAPEALLQALEKAGWDSSKLPSGSSGPQAAPEASPGNAQKEASTD